MAAHIVPLGDPTRHFWITRSVARAMDLNLSEAMSDELLTTQGYAELVTRCRMCPHVEGCMAWLGQNGAGSESAPDFCANADALNQLADRLSGSV